jgi:glycosyltransferase involved in cell wall biosynthesis
MKIHMAFTFRGAPYGGGNQFLRALKSCWEKSNVYAQKHEDADVILFNGHECLEDVIRLKKKYPEKLFIHRVGGPIAKYRPHNKSYVFLDRLVYLMARDLADGVVFQSQWSLDEAKKAGYRDCRFQILIANAADSALFYPPENQPEPGSESKIQLITTCWEKSPNKGFDIYEYLDQHLNYKRYDFTFIGKSPVRFQNIKHIPPLCSEEIGYHLRKSHIFVSASRRESCSNSIIESLSSGLPVVYRQGNSGNEIVKDAGLSFSNGEDAVTCINRVDRDYNVYRDAVTVLSAGQVARKYLEFARGIFNEKEANCYSAKRATLPLLMKYRQLESIRKIVNRFHRMMLKAA